MYGTRFSFNRKDILHSLADHVVSDRHQADGESPMGAERVVAMRQPMLSDAIACLTGVTGDIVAVLITLKGLNGILWMDIQIQYTLQGLVNKAIEETSRFVEFENRLLRNIKYVA